MGSRRAPRHGGGLRLEALGGGEVQGAARHQTLGDGMSGPWPHKLLEATVIVDPWSNAGCHIRGYPRDQSAALVTVVQNASFRTVDLFFCTYTSLTWRTTTHGGTTKVTTTGDRAKI